MDVDQALYRAVNVMGQVLDFQVFGFLLLDESSGKLHLHPSYRGIDLEAAKKLDLRLGKGITGWVVQTGQPLLVPDVSGDPRYIEGAPGMRSEMCVPLKIGERVIGVIDVESDQTNAFSDDDLRLISTLAGQLAVTIEHARLFAETEKKANDLALLLGTSTAISSTLDLDQILGTVAQQIACSLVATLCRITLLEEARENLVIRAAYPIREQISAGDLGRRYPLAMAPWHKQVIETGEPVVLRQDVPELAMSDQERKLALIEGVKSAALVPLIVGGRVLGVISLGEERSWERSPFTPEKVELCQSIARQAAVAIENARLYEETQGSFERLQTTLEGTVNVLVSAIEMRDRYTAGHQRRVTQLACAIAKDMGLPKEQIEGLRMAGLIHDLGKITVPAEILSKPGRLTDIEYGLIKAHPQIGYDVLKTVDFPWPVAQIVLQHHERLSGSGYPQGLSGEEIMLEARILAVADVVEAMATFRPYRPALGIDSALEEISQNGRGLYDPEVVETCLELFAEKGFEFEEGKEVHK
jgi:HD-GYP domain-containing protein (c-di-GMP phosphodiesterase class II)